MRIIISRNEFIRPQLMAAALVFVLGSAVLAADVADYQKRLDSAQAGITVLLENIADEELGKTPEQPNNEVFRTIRALVPASESIETASGSLSTGNEWFINGLNEAEKESDLTKRARGLTVLRERLAAILADLDELDPNQQSITKDSDKQKLAEILERPEYQRPPAEEVSEAGSLLRRLLEWIESWFPKYRPSPSVPSVFGSIATVLIYVMIAAILAVIGFGIYKLLPLFAFRSRRERAAISADRVILGERIGEDQTAKDIFSEAELLARNGDLRGAIRKGYVALLFELSDRKLIGLVRHKTNRDYLRDLRSKTLIYSQMNQLTGSFERHWYGSQAAEPADWEEFRKEYGETINAL